MKRLCVFALAALCLVPAQSQADILPVKVICRGANIPAHVRLIRQAVKAKLKEAEVPYKSVGVTVSKIRRNRSNLSTDFTSALSLSDGSTPTVSFAGAFPAPEACEVTARLRIAVRYESGHTVTFSNITVPGSMLFVKAGTLVSDTNSLD